MLSNSTLTRLKKLLEAATEAAEMINVGRNLGALIPERNRLADGLTRAAEFDIQKTERALTDALRNHASELIECAERERLLEESLKTCVAFIGKDPNVFEGDTPEYHKLRKARAQSLTKETE